MKEGRLRGVNMNKHILICVMAAVMILAVGCKKPEKENTTPSPDPSGTGLTPISSDGLWTTAVDPKPLSDQVKKGLAWLAKNQLENGAWGQGEESKEMGAGMANIKATPNVADTCMATLALIRSGSTPSKGEYSQQILKAVNFICSEIANSDKESLFITSLRGTRTQTKLGQYVDTFMASILLPEVRGKMPDEAGEKRVFAALDKVLDKMERHQKANGTWEGNGWATKISQGLAMKGLNRAAQYGGLAGDRLEITGGAIAKAEERAKEDYKEAKNSGKFGAKESAGVELYDKAQNAAAIQERNNTYQQQRQQAEQVLKTSKDEKELSKARYTIREADNSDKLVEDSTKDTVNRLSDQKFISGFGSNGGEEYLSYLNLSESLVVKGGEEWKKWDDTMTRNLDNIQNTDGSWSGGHCITGRTFCTAAATMVLMADRTPIPVAAKIKKP